MTTAMQNLDNFVAAALARGVSKQQIEDVLGEAGWSIEQSRSALAAYADIAFPVPVPKPRPYLSAREAFLYLALYTTLYLTAFYVGSALFDLIDIKIADAGDLNRWLAPQESLRWDVSFVVVAFPIFAFLAWLTQRALTRDPVKRLSPIRRWLTYLTLFFAGGFLIGDLTTLVYHLLGGETPTRFMLKIIVVGVIAGGIFGFYLNDLRRAEREG